MVLSVSRSVDSEIVGSEVAGYLSAEKDVAVGGVGECCCLGEDEKNCVILCGLLGVLRRDSVFVRGMNDGFVVSRTVLEPFCLIGAEATEQYP